MTPRRGGRALLARIRPRRTPPPPRRATKLPRTEGSAPTRPRTPRPLPKPSPRRPRQRMHPPRRPTADDGPADDDEPKQPEDETDSEEPSARGAVLAAPWRRASRRSPADSLIELVTIVAVALGLALGIQAFLVKPFRIPSESMVPTLEVGQRVLVDRVGDALRRPRAAATSWSSSRRRAPTTTACGVQPSAGSGLPGPTSANARTRTSSSASSVSPATDLKVKRRAGSTSTASCQKEPFIRPDAHLRDLQPAAARSPFRRATTT